MEKKFSASQIVLWVLFILSAIVLIMFFGVGYDHQESFSGELLTAPIYTGLLIFWLYALVVICAGVVFGFGIAKVFRKKSKKAARTGLVGYVFLFMLVAIVVSYFAASTDSVVLGGDKIFEDKGLLKLTDTCLYSMYALLLVAIVAALCSMTGAFKAKVKK